MTHFGVVTMPLLYTCKSSDNYYSVFETSVLIFSNIPFLDNAHTIELYDQEAIWGKNNTLTTSILIDTLTVEAGVLMTLIIHSLPLFVRSLFISV